MSMMVLLQRMWQFAEHYGVWMLGATMLLLLNGCGDDGPRPAEPNKPVHSTPPPEMPASDSLQPIPLGFGEAHLDSLEIVRAQGYPQWVNVLAKGSLSYACQDVDGVRNQYQNQHFTVQFDLSPAMPQCDPQRKAFETLIPLQTAGLSAGWYTVRVHGLEVEFELDVDQTTTF